MKVTMNEKTYNLPKSFSFFEERFESYIEDETIRIDVHGEEEYLMLNELFNCVYNIVFQVCIEESDLPEFGGRIRSLDTLQAFQYKMGNLDKAIEKLRMGIVMLLEYYQQKVREDANEKR